MRRYLAMDIGGTDFKYSLLTQAGKWEEEGMEPTCQDPGEFLEQVLRIGGRFQGQVEGIGISMAGFFDPETGENRDFSVGENFRAFHLKEKLEGQFHLPVLVENDSNCAAVGEMRAGAAKGLGNFCLVTFGTGIGGAICIQGKLYRGSHFKAGEEGLACIGCQEIHGKVVCQKAGGTGLLAKKASAALGRQVDGRYVLSHLKEDVVNQVYQKWLTKAAVVVGNMAVSLDPEAVLIGGGISENPRFLEDLRARAYGMFPHLEEYAKIQACSLGNRAGRLGALWLLLEQMEADGERSMHGHTYG